MQEEEAAVLLSSAAVEGFEGSGLQRGGRFSAGLCGRQGVCRQGNVVPSSSSCRSSGITLALKQSIGLMMNRPTVYPAVRASLIHNCRYYDAVIHTVACTSFRTRPCRPLFSNHRLPHDKQRCLKGHAGKIRRRYSRSPAYAHPHAAFFPAS